MSRLSGDDFRPARDAKLGEELHGDHAGGLDLVELTLRDGMFECGHGVGRVIG